MGKSRKASGKLVSKLFQARGKETRAKLKVKGGKSAREKACSKLGETRKGRTLGETKMDR